jgi:site-specific recombinase XerD
MDDNNKYRDKPYMMNIYCRFMSLATLGEKNSDAKASFKTALAQAGITDFKFHYLRHTFASQLVMAGIDLATVRELLGHKTLTMTLRYSHLAPSHKVRAVDLLDSKLSEGYCQKLQSV